ncbi:ABC transporter ATP-binding protein [Alkalihalobacillus trypoxylicola]|uniref:ABC transporter ATP-binding protein n=1 Tax=Alkalihalobacillus trypoxylicola TaxID=519424 RepID=A0A162DFS1_9BACI|nr:ABC transporter ATP-binding protein [Alkalihalobacillus trypoxylicola]KYG29486.1 ABC transporter ATP-binding protein [Alkalihalobacillus trypoxylicola]
MKTIIEATNLSKHYGMKERQLALNTINLKIETGEFVSVMGPSGSGKTTLLHHLSGMEKIMKGSVKINGKELSTLSEKRLAELRLHQLGFVFQHIHLLKNLNLFDNILLPAYLAKKESKKQIHLQALELMEKTGISKLANHNITEASGGQLQRVAICRALINSPTILFGDEPTGALNSAAAENIMDIFTMINEEDTTIVLVTHDSKVAAKTERVLFMLDGKIVAEKYLGKYSRGSGHLKEREEALTKWLKTIGF